MPGIDAPARVKSRVHALTVEHAPRTVSSVYFDSARYESFRQSSSGTSERMKLRLRWYGDLHHAVSPTLELKHRLNQVGHKTWHAVDSIDLDDTTWASVRTMLRARVPGPDRLHIEAMRCPILVATYRRHYFVTSDRRIRVTVDTNLRFFDQRQRPKPNLVFDSAKADFAVVECKLARSVDENEAHILDPLNLRWTRFSKYCFGLGALARL